jgi:hypothetical protein
MATDPMPLDQMAQRIAKQEAELRALRQEYATRKQRLDELIRRKKTLQAQLAQVESALQEFDRSKLAPPAPAPKPAPAAKPPKPAAAQPVKPKQPLPLTELLANILRETGRPLSNRELTEEVRRRKFPSKAGDLLKQVTTRVSELIKKGVLRRTKDQKSVTLAGSTDGKKSPPSAAKTAPRKASSKGKPGKRR